MKTCNTFDTDFLWIANVLFSKECQSEIGCNVYIYPKMNFIYNKYGFVSYRECFEFYYFDYGYVFPQYRGHGEYKRLFLQREIICGGKLCKIETKNTILKLFLVKNNYEIYKNNGSWTFFQKYL